MGRPIAQPESEPMDAADLPPGMVSTRRVFEVQSASGGVVKLQSQDEAAFYTNARHMYLTENKFTYAQDLRELDRLLFYETQMFRWQRAQAEGVDLDGSYLTTSDLADLRRSIKETQPLLTAVQTALGLTKAQRDKEVETVAGYIAELRRRAKEFGVHRENQLGKALELMNDVIATAGAWKRSDEVERKKLGFRSPEDVIDYILEVAAPQFEQVDEHFRTHEQRYWVRRL